MKKIHYDSKLFTGVLRQAIVGMPVKDGTNLKTEDPKGSEGSESSESFDPADSKNSKNSEGSGSDSGSSSSEAEKQGKLGRSPEEKKRKEEKKKQQRYFNDFFNVFDFFIVWMSVFDLFGAKLKGSIGEGSNQSNFSQQSSVKILSKFNAFC